MHQIQRETRTVKRIVTALMPSLLFRYFSLFLPHLRTLAQEKRSQNCLAVKRIVTALIPSLLFRYFSLFLPHLRTLAQEKRSQNCLRFGTGGPSLCLYPLLSRNIIFSPALIMAAHAKKQKFWRSDLLTLSACTIGILNTLTYTELIARLC